MINILIGVIEALTIRIGAVVVKKSRKEEFYDIEVLAAAPRPH